MLSNFECRYSKIRRQSAVVRANKNRLDANPCARFVHVKVAVEDRRGQGKRFLLSSGLFHLRDNSRMVGCIVGVEF